MVARPKSGRRGLAGAGEDSAFGPTGAASRAELGQVAIDGESFLALSVDAVGALEADVATTTGVSLAACASAARTALDNTAIDVNMVMKIALVFIEVLA
ncbi:MAG: hypothetical protein ACKVQK_11795 [Burkholderiales bacterium]